MTITSPSFLESNIPLVVCVRECGLSAPLRTWVSKKWPKSLPAKLVSVDQSDGTPQPFRIAVGDASPLWYSLLGQRDFEPTIVPVEPRPGERWYTTNNTIVQVGQYHDQSLWAMHVDVELGLPRYSIDRWGRAEWPRNNILSPDLVVPVDEEIDDALLPNRAGSDYDSTADTLRHILRVQALISQFVKLLLDRAVVHDASKLGVHEKPYFDEATPLLRQLSYGTDEYRKSLSRLRPALDHHNANNSHHPEHYPNGVDDMTLMDVVEMFFDWKAASERHADGDILRSVEINEHRFRISPQLAKIFRNTALDLFGADSNLR